MPPYQSCSPPRPARRHGRQPGKRRFGATAAALALLAVVPVLTATPAGATSGAPPSVPTTGAYLGAFVAPHQSIAQAQGDIRQPLSELNNFDSVIGRPLGLVHVFQTWASPVRNAVLAAFASTGATPVVDWSCISDASVINGSQDSVITAYAAQLKDYQRPVFLRWFWEMNLVNGNRASACLNGLGSAGYVQAWQHIRAIFQQVGATNVSFVWCPSIVSPDFAAPFYPGDQNVDWIGFDGYDRHQDPNMLTTQFLPFYNHWLPNGKPIMIGETGATIDQATYVAQLAARLPTQFPDIHAVLYYDSHSTSDWTLTNAPGNLGLSQFSAMGRLAYFMYPFAGS